MKYSAVISADGKYRYKLFLIGDPKSLPLVWVMSNPSTADTRKDDRTIRLCNTSAMESVFGGIGVYNLYALLSLAGLHHGAELWRLDSSRFRCIFAERKVGSRVLVVPERRLQNAAQRGWVEHHDVIKAFAAD